MPYTALQRAADALLSRSQGTTLQTFIRSLRSEGASADRISRDLYDATDGVIGVSRGTMYAWIRQFDEAA